MKKLNILVFMLLFVPVMFFGCGKAKDNITNNNTYNIQNTYNITQSESLSMAAENALPGTVTVWVATENNFTTGSMGSGAIIESDGYIVTNHHVISSKLTNSNLHIYVFHYDSDEAHEVELLYHNSSLDIAILKDDCSGNYPVLKMEDRWITPVLDANSEPNKLKVLEDVIAIGTPISMKLRSTVTLGHINSTLYRFASSDTNSYERLIQFDAAISSGNSGGPLIDKYGNIVGLSTLQVKDDYDDYGDANSLFFAVPIKPVMLVIDKVKAAYEAGSLTGSYYDSPKLGITIVDKHIKPSEETFNEAGVKVISVNNPGASHGKLAVNDIITGIIVNGTTYEVNLRDDLTYAQLRCEAGQTITLLRKGKANVNITF